MKVYLAGPMAGMPESNLPAFHAAAAKLRAEGHVVFNPAELPIEKDRDYRAALGQDLAWICAEAEAIALLPGWVKSKGAQAEFATAHAIGLEVIELCP